MFEGNTTYTATIADYGLSATKKGKEFVWITFKSEGVTGTVTHKCWLTTTKAQEHAAKTLLKLGWNKDLEAIGKGIKAGALDHLTAVEIETETEEYTKADGTEGSIVTVKWINIPGEGGGFEALTPEKVSTLSTKMKTAALAAEKKSPEVAATTKASKLPLLTPEGGQPVESDIPF
jgi:hypothetical protein